MKNLLPRAYRSVLGSLAFILILGTIGLFLINRQAFLSWSWLLAWIWGLYLSHILGLIFILRQIYHPVKQLERLVERLRQGNYSQDYVQQSIPLYNRIGSELTAFGHELKNHQAQRLKEEEQLALLLNDLSVGVLILGIDGRITLANQTVQAYFSDEAVIGEPLAKVSKAADLNRLVEAVYQTKTSHSQEMDFFWPEDKIVEVSVSPVVKENQVSQVLLLFYDVTHMRQLERTQKDFISNVSHELKTPVTSIKGFAETLLLGAKEDPVVLDKFLEIIHKESNRLQEIIRDILYLSKLEQPRQELQLESLDLEELVRTTIEGLSPQLKEKSLTVDCVSRLSDLYLGDRGKVTQVLLNLLSNAIRYTEPGGLIKVTMTEDDRSVKIAVEDTGIGIPEHELNRIFERFYRVNKGRSRETGGTGLGLPIVKTLLASMEGQIRVDSQPGVGSTFTISLTKINGSDTK
ncbi:two-component system phosphate regulon sensor histidine kinase PhoR [Streptococcus rupicaprae]|uniref:histidine kinase n=1 Tax=Streptococcus rupicaprae TaxID=759619 RepID=A0ABV2FHR2_9STRE